ncbi:D-serine dehydratase [compost metagenome]
MYGAIRLLQQGQSYLEKNALVNHLPQATHLVWATGGSMVPPTMRAAYLAKAKEFN